MTTKADVVDPAVEAVDQEAGDALVVVALEAAEEVEEDDTARMTANPAAQITASMPKETMETLGFCIRKISVVGTRRLEMISRISFRIPWFRFRS